MPSPEAPSGGCIWADTRVHRADRVQVNRADRVPATQPLPSTASAVPAAGWVMASHGCTGEVRSLSSRVVSRPRGSGGARRGAAGDCSVYAFTNFISVHYFTKGNSILKPSMGSMPGIKTRDICSVWYTSLGEFYKGKKSILQHRTSLKVRFLTSYYETRV